MSSPKNIQSLIDDINQVLPQSDLAQKQVLERVRSYLQTQNQEEQTAV
ncbi:MAG: hypothetical protein F6K24_38760, partial [Okeania sp. SIO2D1]|nr:hypothetical protein [Okeania sp. SIO2D1]